MKRLIFAGLVMTLLSSAAAVAQSNGGYVDDVYYNGSQAQQDAKADAKKQKKQQATQQGAEYYNSSTGTNDGYYADGNNGVYNSSYDNGDDAYIDYDDDSYTSRIRRFYYPMSGIGYWGSVYSPFWYDPFYNNPYYGWGGWYTPGFSIGFGWGGGPYWNNCWGMNTWFGYGGFGSWYYPYWGGYYGGWGGGYGAGYWNGYYAGLYDGGRYNPVYGRGTVNYGPRGSRNGLMSSGVYGRNSGMRAANTGSNMVEPMNRRSNRNIYGNSADNINSSRGGMQVEGGRNAAAGNRGIDVGRSNNAIRLDNGRTYEVNQSAAGRQQVQQQEQPSRRGSFFGNMFRGNQQSAGRSSNGINVERSQPSRSYNNNNYERSQPSRSFNNSRPAPSPSRSFSSPSRGGGSSSGRVGGGRR